MTPTGNLHRDQQDISIGVPHERKAPFSAQGLEGIDESYLFGSWARRYDGEPGPPPGDIDVVIIGDPDVDEVYEACREAGAVLGQEVNPVILTQQEWQGRRSSFVRQIGSGPLVAIAVQ